MNESRKNKLTQARKLICLVSIVVMLSGLLFSRVLLSAGLILFAGVSVLHENMKDQLKTFFSSPFLWSMTLLFVLPLLSGLWSEDVAKWSQILRIKLPLLILPVCFAGLDYLAEKDWEKIALAFLIVVMTGVGWSMWQYFHDVNAIHAAYLKAQTIRTPLDNDHVRFSLLCSIAIVTAVFLLIRQNKKIGVVVALYLASFVFIIYLHILAVRTGLICFYLGSVIFIIWSISHFKNKARHSWLFILIALFPLASWFAFPTFKNRISYLKYDLSTVKRDAYRKNSNDGDRILSIQAGWQLQNEHPLSGIGFGDIKNETDKWYSSNFPEMSDADKILPSSEWMLYGAGTGWPGFLFFSMVMVIPFFLNGLKKIIWWWLLNIFMALSYLFDIGLEVQYGVFVHAFILLWWYKWLSAGPKTQKP